tara:strand:- start:1156 stop:1623 length:468 start_codon:yes stop_codon:yes gene_type:complete
MIKIYKKIIIFIFPIIILSCGYSPMYKDLKNLTFNISIQETLGNREINNIIKSRLKSYELNKNATEKYNISINSEYQKIIDAKDTTGAATNYKIVITSTFNISSENFNKVLIFSENFSMKSLGDRLEEQDYEKNIQNSLSNIIARKLILRLSQSK